MDWTRKTSLLHLANLIKQSQLLVTNNSVSIHVAAVVDKEAVFVFTGENHGRSAPYPKEICNKDKFICLPHVKAMIKVGIEMSTFLSLDYNSAIDSIRLQLVTEAVEKLWNKK